MGAEAAALGFAVAALDADQRQHAGADRARCLAADGDAGLGDALDERDHAMMSGISRVRSLAIWSLRNSLRFFSRRSYHDVTDSVQTTDPAAVGAEVVRLSRSLFNGARVPELERAFSDPAAMYAGAHPEYCACDTGYHDIQHVLDVTLAMARLIEGYQRSRRNGDEPMTREVL